MAEQIVAERGFQTVLVSLARAGTPIGVLIKRYLFYKYDQSFPHYSISIIRDRGIDEEALRYILNEHPGSSISFIDGWT
ncbi:tellurite-like stress resistance cysteine protease StiP, partial [Micrococcus sp. SIMBA_144]